MRRVVVGALLVLAMLGSAGSLEAQAERQSRERREWALVEMQLRGVLYALNIAQAVREAEGLAPLSADSLTPFAERTEIRLEYVSEPDFWGGEYAVRAENLQTGQVCTLKVFRQEPDSLRCTPWERREGRVRLRIAQLDGRDSTVSPETGLAAPPRAGGRSPTRAAPGHRGLRRSLEGQALSISGQKSTR